VRQHVRVDVRVRASASTARERDATARSLDDFRQPTPVWSNRLCHVEMTGSNDESKLLEGTRVDRKLAGQAVERVAGTLDLVAVQVAVEDGQIDTTFGVGEPKLVDHQDIMPYTIVSKMTLPQSGSNPALTICFEGSHRR